VATGLWFMKKFKTKYNLLLAKLGESTYLYSHHKKTNGQTNAVE
jgi:hypothetical protein